MSYLTSKIGYMERESTIFMVEFSEECSEAMPRKREPLTLAWHWVGEGGRSRA